MNQVSLKELDALYEQWRLNYGSKTKITFIEYVSIRTGKSISEISGQIKDFAVNETIGSWDANGSPVFD